MEENSLQTEKNPPTTDHSKEGSRGTTKRVTSKERYQLTNKFLGGVSCQLTTKEYLEHIITLCTLVEPILLNLFVCDIMIVLILENCSF
jgi:hypothetical protein